MRCQPDRGQTPQQSHPNDWDNPSLCPGWTARAIVGHVIDGQRQITSILEHNRRLPPSDDPATVAGVDPVAALHSARQSTDLVLADLDPATTIATPGGDTPIGAIIGQAALEPLVHAWDFATATNTAFSPDSNIAQRLLEQLLPTIDALNAIGMYGTKQTYNGDNPMNQLVALLGRQPRR